MTLTTPLWQLIPAYDTTHSPGTINPPLWPHSVPVIPAPSPLIPDTTHSPVTPNHPLLPRPLPYDPYFFTMTPNPPLWPHLLPYDPTYTMNLKWILWWGNVNHVSDIIWSNLSPRIVMFLIPEDENTPLYNIQSSGLFKYTKLCTV